MAAKTKNQEPSFEEALNELESIVRLMEEGNLDLNDALCNFEKGIALSRLCSEKLEQAEKKIDVLLCSKSGDIILKPANIVREENE